MQTPETRPVTPASGGSAPRTPDRRLLPKPSIPFQAVLEEGVREARRPPERGDTHRKDREEEGDRREERAPLTPAEVARPLVIRETFQPTRSGEIAPVDAAQIQMLAETMLRSLRIGGDGRGGKEARLEIGRGRWEGTVVRLVCEGGKVRAVVSDGAEDLAAKLTEAFAERGVDLQDIEVGR